MNIFGKFPKGKFSFLVSSLSVCPRPGQSLCVHSAALSGAWLTPGLGRWVWEADPGGLRPGFTPASLSTRSCCPGSAGEDPA